MSYIEREKAIAEIDKGNLLVGNNAEWAKEILHRTPTADVVEVVRCKDCKHSTTYELWNGRPYIACIYNGLISEVSADHYCSYGERREE